MSEQIRMSDRWVRSLKVGKGREEYCDTIVPCLRLRVSRLAKKWSVISGKGRTRRRLALGEYPSMSLAEARQVAEARLADPSIDPLETIFTGGEWSRTPNGVTLEALCSAYVEKMEANGQGAARQYRGRLITGKYSFCRFVERQLGRQALANAVTPELVTDWLRETFERSPGQMRQDRSYIHAVYAWALKADFDPKRSKDAPKFGITTNPAASVASGGLAKARDRVVSLQELYAFWHLLPDVVSPRMTLALRLLISMGGLRVSEVIAAEKAWFKDAWLNLPKTKNGKAHSVPLTENAKIQLESVLPLSPRKSRFLFPNERDLDRPYTLTSVSKATKRIVENYGFEKFQLRDLRRSFKTHLLEREMVEEREIDIWHNHGQNADVARKHYTWAEYKSLKQRVAKQINEFLNLVLAQEIELPEKSFKAANGAE